jgi:hypothetical protein
VKKVDLRIVEIKVIVVQTFWLPEIWVFFTKRFAKFLYMGHVGSQKIWKDV